MQASRSTLTNPKRPLPDEIDPSVKRQKKDDQTQADEDWFKGNICQFYLNKSAQKKKES